MNYMLGTLLLLTSCMTASERATPDKWAPEMHAQILMQCRVACRYSVYSYDAWLAKCLCAGKPRGQRNAR